MMTEGIKIEVPANYGQTTVCVWTGSDGTGVNSHLMTTESPGKEGVKMNDIDDRLAAEYAAERDREASVPAVWEDDDELSLAFTPALQVESGGEKTAESTPLCPPGPDGLDSILPTNSCNPK